MMKIGLLNTHKSRLVNCELRKLVTNENFDIILVQEPWQMGIEKAMGLKTRTVYKKSSSPSAVIYILNNDLQVMALEETTESMACALIRNGPYEYLAVSVYCHSNKDIYDDIQRIRNLISKHNDA